MRITKPLTYHSIVQALEKGSCVICVCLKSFQSSLLERVQPASIKELCNYHGWAMAAAVNGKNAAEIFLCLLEDDAGGVRKNGCDLCAQILEEQQLKLKELGHALQQPGVFEELERHHALCFCHANGLASVLSLDQQKRALAMTEHNREHLKSSLYAFLDQLASESHAGGGTLGRAAELLFGYRGLPRPEEKR